MLVLYIWRYAAAQCAPAPLEYLPNRSPALNGELMPIMLSSITQEEAAARLRNAVAAYPTRGTSRLKLWAKALGLGIVVFMVVMPLGLGDPLWDPAQGTFWMRLLAGVFVGVVSVLESDYRLWRISRDPKAAAVRLHSRIVHHTTAGWLMRTVRMGVVIGLCIGIPVAVYNAALTPTPWSRELSEMIRFVATGMIWAVPLAFAMRWAHLRWWERTANR